MHNYTRKLKYFVAIPPGETFSLPYSKPKPSIPIPISILKISPNYFFDIHPHHSKHNNPFRALPRTLFIRNHLSRPSKKTAIKQITRALSPLHYTTPTKNYKSPFPEIFQDSLSRDIYSFVINRQMKKV